MADIHRLVVTRQEAGERLDRRLARDIASLSRERIKALIAAGAVRVNDAEMRSPSRLLKSGDRVEVDLAALPPPVSGPPMPQALPLEVVYEDDALLVVDKPAGMVVHPAAGSPDETLVNALLHHCGGRLSTLGGNDRPGIVHRIDKDTSGLLVVARTDAAHAALARQFAAHEVARRYVAFVHGSPEPSAGRIDAPLGRHPVDRKRIAVLREGGRRAVTHYETMAVYRSSAGTPVAACLACRLETGRTHQVRVHLAQAGWPLIGDPVYGRKGPCKGGGDHSLARILSGFPRQALHAAMLGFTHPESGEFLQFASPLPYDLAQLRAALELRCRTTVHHRFTDEK